MENQEEKKPTHYKVSVENLDKVWQEMFPLYSQYTKATFTKILEAILEPVFEEEVEKQE